MFESSFESIVCKEQMVQMVFYFLFQASRHHNKFLMKVHKAGDLPLMQVQHLDQLKCRHLDQLLPLIFH